jgi:hypothetical protein
MFGGFVRGAVQRSMAAAGGAPTVWRRPLVSPKYLSGQTQPTTRKKKSSAAAAAAAPVAAEAAADGEPIYDFRKEVTAMIKRMQVAIEPMVKQNDNFKVYFAEENHLVVETSRGNFDFRPDYKEGWLVLKSYISGYQNYRFDPEEGQWLSVKDNHDMRGLVIRDLIHHCVGCPDLN